MLIPTSYYPPTVNSYPDITSLTEGNRVSDTTNFGTQNTSLVFKPDGTKAYFIDAIADEVQEYDLSTANDISTATHGGVYDPTSETGSVAWGLAFNDTGSKMYVGSSSAAYQYSLSTNWDITTASYDSVSLSLTAATGRAFSFGDSGSKLYQSGTTGSDAIYQYNLSTPYDLSTGSYASKSFDVQTEVGTRFGNGSTCAFSSDGLKVWVILLDDALYELDLSTAWDISTASYNSVSFSPSATFVDTVGGGNFYPDLSGYVMLGTWNSGADKGFAEYTL